MDKKKTRRNQLKYMREVLSKKKEEKKKAIDKPHLTTTTGSPPPRVASSSTLPLPSTSCDSLPHTTTPPSGDSSSHSTTPVTASARKLAFSIDFDTSYEEGGQGYLLVDECSLLEWMNSCVRCQCGKKMQVRQEGAKGMTKTFAIVCRECKEKKTWCTSPGGGRCVHDVHRRIVRASLHSSGGYVARREFCLALNMPLLSEDSFYRIAKEIEDSGIVKYEKIMEETREKVHEKIKMMDPSAPDIKNIKVSCDGSWSKRGFTSNYGFVSVIEFTTGMVLDFVVLSKRCKVCVTNNGRNRDEWWPDHEEQCDKNFHGSSPAMEMEGWKILWGRSEEKCKFRYVTVVSDSDSKGFSAVRDLKPYGDVVIEKEECTNHVSKRLAKALLDVKKVQKLGALTQDKVMRLAGYFANAIKLNTTVEDMKAIYATLRHCSSSDETPQHSGCPDGEDSWCFAKIAMASDQPIPSHKEHLHTYLRPDVVKNIMPIYMRIATNKLLEKCKGDTQNSNESLHNVIWNLLPKTKFFCRRRMEYGVHRAVTHFNLGSVVGEVDTFGMAGKKIMEKQDRHRLTDSKRKAENKESIKKRKIRKIQEEEQKKDAEGDTYVAGGAEQP